MGERVAFVVVVVVVVVVVADDEAFAVFPDEDSRDSCLLSRASCCPSWSCAPPADCARTRASEFLPSVLIGAGGGAADDDMSTEEAGDASSSSAAMRSAIILVVAAAAVQLTYVKNWEQ